MPSRLNIVPLPSQAIHKLEVFSDFMTDHVHIVLSKQIKQRVRAVIQTLEGKPVQETSLCPTQSRHSLNYFQAEPTGVYYLTLHIEGQQSSYCIKKTAA